MRSPVYLMKSPGLVIEVKAGRLAQLKSLLETHQLLPLMVHLGQPNDRDELLIKHRDGEFRQSRTNLQQIWSRTSYEMASRRDHPDDCDREFALLKEANPGLSPEVTFDFSDQVMAPYINTAKPRVAILREQGVNGTK